MENKRLVWPDFLRIISIFFVILIHVTSVGLRDYEVGSSVWVWSGIFNSMSGWAVPVFFMISGMFFLDPLKDFDIKRFFKKNVLRVVLCIIAWGGIYSILDQYLYGTISLKSIPIAIYGILTDNTGYHLWFLYTLLILYVSTPFLRVFTKYADKRQLDYALLVWFLLAAAVPTANSLAKEIVNFNELFPYEPIAIAGYGGYYLLGFRLRKYPLKKKCFTVSMIIGVFSFVLMPFGNMLLSYHKMHFCGILSSSLGICCCLFSIALFSLVSRWNLNAKWITWMGQRVFGIYLVHVFWVSLGFHILHFKLDILPAGISIIGVSTLTFILSFLLSYILSFIPIFRRVI